MKVSELLEQLKDANPDSEVSIIVPVGCCGENELIKITDIDDVLGSVFIYTETFPLFPSCRTLGNAVRIEKDDK